MPGRGAEPWPRFMDWFGAFMPGEPGWRTTYARSLRVEEFARDGSMVIRVEIPGIDPDRDVDITIEDGQLCITGRRELSSQEPTRSEFYYGQFLRTLPLPTGARPEDIEATYSDGILEITLPVGLPERDVVHVPVHRQGEAEQGRESGATPDT